jgi:suppressor for copper-sensitivity B
VLAKQVGDGVAMAAAAAMASAGLALWLARGRRIAVPVAAALAFGAVTLPAITGAPPIAASTVMPGVLAFSAEEAERRARSGETLLVDITADWCVTCQVNKAMVLDRGAVAERLRSGAVGVMRGDWTRPDPAIAAYLARHGRVGIPFNAVYGPAAPQGIPLPELLTEGTVLDAFSRAHGSAQAAR